MKRTTMLWKLFTQFLKFGCFTFGGGWSIVAQMQQRYVEKEKLLQPEELTDLTSVGRSMPGTMIGNVAMLFGCRMAGIAGGLACVTGMILPPMLILMAVTCGYTLIMSSPVAAAAMAGIRAAVVPIILSGTVSMLKGAFRFPPCYAVTALTLVLYLFFQVNCAWLVVIGAVCGFLISECCERRGGKGEKTE